MREESIPELLNRFLAFGEAIRNYNPTTIRNYRSTFKVFFKDTRAFELSDLNKKMVEGWFFDGRIKRKWSSATFRHNHKHLNVFFKWLIKEGLIEENYLADLEKPRMESKIPRTLSAEDASLVLEASFHLSYRYRHERYRNRAVVAIMLFAGLRRNEVIKLKLNDVSMENRTIFIDQGKGGKDRLIPMNARLYGYLREYLNDRRRIAKDQIHFFLSIGNCKPLGQKGITKLIARLRNATKLDFSAHTFRHSFATLMLEGGCDIYTLSKIMGHSKITTTTIYLSCSKQQMEKSIEMHSLN